LYIGISQICMSIVENLKRERLFDENLQDKKPIKKQRKKSMDSDTEVVLKQVEYFSNEEIILDEMPDEILMHLLTFMECKDLALISRLSKAWQFRAEDNQLYKLLVAKYFHISPSILHSSDKDVEEDWKQALYDIFTTIIRNDKYSWPSGLATPLTRKSHKDIRFLEDGLSATFTGEIGGNQVIFANSPFSAITNGQTVLPFILLDAFYVNSLTSSKPEIHYRIARRHTAYYEIKISKSQQTEVVRSSRGYGGPCIAIGLASSMFPSIGYQPGWLRNSYGYHSDDGNAFHIAGKKYASKFGAGDTIGVGVDFLNNHIFFTKNGQPLDVAFTNIYHRELYPVVGLDSNDIVTLNFGSTPFAYNFQIPPANLVKVQNNPQVYTFGQEDSSDDEEAEDETRTARTILRQVTDLIRNQTAALFDREVSDDSDSDVLDEEENNADDDSDDSDFSSDSDGAEL